VQSDDPDTHNPEAFFEEAFKPLIEYLNDPEKAKEILEPSEFEQDKTQFPFTLNIKNPYYDSYKSSYFLPKCRNCNDQSCKNCPMPVNGHLNIWELLENMASKKSFMDNEHLYRLNRDDIKTKQETL
jgi:hypothetical protein